LEDFPISPTGHFTYWLFRLLFGHFMCNGLPNYRTPPQTTADQHFLTADQF